MDLVTWLFATAGLYAAYVGFFVAFVWKMK